MQFVISISLYPALVNYLKERLEGRGEKRKVKISGLEGLDEGRIFFPQSSDQ